MLAYRLPLLLAVGTSCAGALRFGVPAPRARSSFRAHAPVAQMLEEVVAEKKQAPSSAAPWPWWLKATPASGLDDNETAASVYGDIDVSQAAQDVKQLLLDDKAQDDCVNNSEGSLGVHHTGIEHHLL